MALPAVIEPCLPSPGERPPTRPDWVHEIKHDGYRLMARRDPVSVGIRLLTRNGHDWASRYPLIVQAVTGSRCARARFDGEAVCCDYDGVPSLDDDGRVQIAMNSKHYATNSKVVAGTLDRIERSGMKWLSSPTNSATS
jgi:ATP-dependent DNA ligase